jgi:hypothetical protein
MEEEKLIEAKGKTIKLIDKIRLGTLTTS